MKLNKGKTWWVAGGSLLVVILIIIGVFWFRGHQRQADADAQVTKALKQGQQLDGKIAKHWAQKNVYVTASTTNQAVTALNKTAVKLTQTVDTYRDEAPQAVAKKITQFDAAATKRTQALKRLTRAAKATIAVNALTKPQALKGKTVNDEALIKASATAAKVKKATKLVAASNKTLKQTLTSILTTCTAQLKEREALAAATAKVATAGKLKAGVALEALTAYQAFIKGMTYPKLAAGQADLTAAVAKAIANTNIKGISLTELQRRIFYIYSDGKAADAAYIETNDGLSAFKGDHYQASVWGIYLSGYGLSTRELADFDVAANGDYTLKHGFDTIKQGNVLKDVSAAQLKTVRADVTKGIEPKKRALTAIFPSAKAFYDWALTQVTAPDAAPDELKSNVSAEFSSVDSDDLFTVDAQYDVSFNYSNGPDGDPSIGHFGRIILAKDGTVYSGLPGGVLGQDTSLTMAIMQKQYGDQ
ncbi:hypothetical protein [Lacticaseibacillus suibinensis]|uniref:hypothetical protein n=1 Tax=Lacticaseibacillus suibinensis TaxID=2486011 RepID=UPI000F7750B0|nr:hypothetical protein [Lacticaseibacillus suibinensis]